jgi:glycosyltransferase involved in cell wall biosynthesis
MKIVYIANVDWFFISHRLPLALEAKKRGFSVHVVAGDTGVGQTLNRYGINFIPWSITRSGTNLKGEVSSISKLYSILTELDPDIVHNVGIKSVIYGTLCALRLKKPHVNAIAGMGYSFTANSPKARIVRFMSKPLFLAIFKSARGRLILQNSDDKAWFLEKKYATSNNIRLIRGSGVDLGVFKSSKEPIGNAPIVCLPSRMLWDKGIGEFVRAVEILKTENKVSNVRFVLVGGIDSENPAGIGKSTINDWVQEGLIEWWGFQSNMAKVISQATIIVLPSYKEGLPKVLIEAGAVGRSVITTDVVGCRELIKDKFNGILVPAKDPVKLAAAISHLLANGELRELYISNGLVNVRDNYTIQKIVSKTFSIYEELLF